MARRTTRIGVTAVAAILGCGEHAAYKTLRKWEHVYPRAQDGTYDARILDLIRTLRDTPHRALEPVHSDWLARYLKEPHAPTHPHPRRRP